MRYEGDVETPVRNFGRLVDDGVDEVITVVLPETESIPQFSDPI
jgi:CO dehydrogenase nickel-insertion accessory protein CooC1